MGNANEHDFEKADDRDDDIVDMNGVEDIDSGTTDESGLPEVALSLDDLGRAYAKAVGLTSANPPKAVASSTEVPSTSLTPVEPDAALDLDVCPISPKSIVEAILFVGAPSDEELTTRKIASWLRDISPSEVKQIVQELDQAYADRQAAYRIEIDKSKVRMVLTPEAEQVREKFYGEVKTAKLTQQAIDVLAIVAYNQPVVAGEVDKLRGKPCSAILKQLERRQLLATTAAAEENRGTEYRTTDRFLQLFGLETLEDLPQAGEAPLDDDLE